MCLDHGTHGGKTQEDKSMLERRMVVQALAAGGALTATGCATNAETGASQFLLVGDRQLSQMAASSWAEAKQKTPVSRDPRYTRRLETIGGRISRGANKHNEAWDYAVFDSDTKNAFVLPGNRVGFYKGMMDFAESDDQIAAIMGHEVGHVTGKHAAERVSQQLGGQVALTGLSIGLGVAGARGCNKYQGAERSQCLSRNQRNTQLAGAALGLGFQYGIILPYSRKHESQSDLLGAKYMHKAGYDPYQAVKLWEKMAEANPNRPPEFMSTHPDPSRRARDLHNYIKYQEQLGSQGWESIKLPKS